MTIDSISKQTHRRFLLASQALWPGRRFEGPLGAESALRQMQALQLDPLVMIARSQDIAMYGRSQQMPETLPGMYHSTQYYRAYCSSHN